MNEELLWEKITITPVRLIPFDIGYSLDIRTLDGLNKYLSLYYKSISLSLKKVAILSDSTLGFAICDNIEMYIYKTGIGILVIKEKQCIYNKDYFCINYSDDRLKAHSEILNWTYEFSEKIKNIIAKCREYVGKINKDKTIRISGLKSFELDGISYVMTISFINLQGSGIQMYEWDTLPKKIKSNIYILLDPSIISKEDSLIFKSIAADDNSLKHIVDDFLITEKPIDYEKRKKFSAYMSWASVIIVGEYTSNEVVEYIDMEIELQHDWYYIYCLDKNLICETKKLLKMGYDVIKLKMLSYEMDLLENRWNYVDDSSVPERIKYVQHGLIASSNIEDLLKRYRKKLDFCLETLIFESQIKQKKYSKSSEILLYFIAFIQVVSILFNVINKYINNDVLSNFIIVVIFFSGALFFIFKG